MKIVTSTSSGVVIPVPAIQICSSSDPVVSLEATLCQKTIDAGKELDYEEKEYVRLQFEKNLLVSQYPKLSDRKKDVVKRLQDLKNILKKIEKTRPVDDPLKLPFKKTTSTAAERKRTSRMAQSNETKQKELESDRRRKETNEEREKARLRMSRLRK